VRFTTTIKSEHERCESYKEIALYVKANAKDAKATKNRVVCKSERKRCESNTEIALYVKANAKNVKATKKSHCV
jgi:hypothetical protein